MKSEILAQAGSSLGSTPSRGEERGAKRSGRSSATGLPVKRLATLAVSVAATLAALAGPAHANGRFPATNSIVVAPRDPSFLVLRATYGVLVSTDAGKNWDWVCEQSLGFSGIEDPPIALTERPAIVGALFAGVTVSHDRGCGFSILKGSVDKRIMNDVVVAHARPREVLAIASSFGSRDDAGKNRYVSTLFRSDDEGASFAATGGDVDPTVLFETVEIAESDPSRVYLSGTRDEAAGPVGVVLVSSDRGATWTEHRIPLVGGERAPYIGAVDPANPDRVYVRTGGSPELAKSRLLVSDDGARTFREAWASEGPMTGLAISPDGQKVYAGSAKDGLHVADKTALVFEKRAQIQVQCITATKDRIYLCSNELYGFVAGESADDGRTFTPMLRLSGLRGPLSCASGTTTHDECQKLWPRLRSELGIPVDAGADAGSSPVAPTPSEEASGCGTAKLGGGAGAIALVAILAYLARRRRPS